MGGTESS